MLLVEEYSDTNLLYIIPVWRGGRVPALFIVTNINVLRRRYFHIKFPPQQPSPTHLSGHCHARMVWHHYVLTPLAVNNSNTHWYALFVKSCVWVRFDQMGTSINFGCFAAYFKLRYFKIMFYHFKNWPNCMMLFDFHWPLPNICCTRTGTWTYYICPVFHKYILNYCKSASLIKRIIQVFT